MDRLTALRLAAIRNTVDGARVAIELLGRLHIAVIIAALTFAGSAVVAAAIGQLTPFGLSLALGSVALLVAAEVRALFRLAASWARNVQWAEQAIETLMLQEVDKIVDDSEADQGGT